MFMFVFFYDLSVPLRLGELLGLMASLASILFIVRGRTQIHSCDPCYLYISSLNTFISFTSRIYFVVTFLG